MNEAELLFTDILNYDRHRLYTDKNILLDKGKRQLISQALRRRINGEPIQYIIGKAQFLGLEFKVNKDVLIPRPETEILVETAIKLGQGSRVVGDRLKILDIGTGCGCIAISLAKFLSNAEIYAIDVSIKSLKIAEENTKLNNVNIKFMQGDLFNTYNLQPTTYNLIVSNPPYIPTAEINKLQPEIRYEPRIALDGGEDGLDFYRRLIQKSPPYLKPAGFLILEIGDKQKEAIEKIFQKDDIFEIIDIVQDYNNIDRVIVARHPTLKDGSVSAYCGRKNQDG